MPENPVKRRRGLSATTIKLIAAVAMLLDHIAWYWFPETAAPGFILHLLGRITAPIMCFFIAEGYYRTRNVMRYALRLLVFAVIAQAPYHYFMTGSFVFTPFSANADYSGMYNVIFTMLLGLIALAVIDSGRIPRGVRLFIAMLCCAATYFCDWPFFGVLFILAFGVRHGDFLRQTLLYLVACTLLLADVLLTGGVGSLYQAGVLLALPLLWLYNGERSARAVSDSPVAGYAAKYAFYVFYPLHLLILAALLHSGLV